MNNPLISIIIPVYNAETFLARAMDSVLKQTCANYEVILVNDGSVDTSGSLCDDYAAAHSHIHVVHKANGGISSTRNAGIEAATGEYLVFLDADDYLSPDTCDLLQQVITAHRPDLIDLGWVYVYGDDKHVHNRHEIQKNTLLDADFLKNTVLPPLLNLTNDPAHFIYDFSCTKVFCRDIITTHKLRFDEGCRIWEDRPFVLSYLRHCRYLYCLDAAIYYYVSTPNSLSRRYNPDCLRIIVENYLLYRSLYGEDYDFDTAYANNYWASAMENMILRSLDQKENQKQIHELMTAVLRREPVIHWFTHRTEGNALQQRISCSIAAGQTNLALSLFKILKASKYCVRITNAIKRKFAGKQATHIQSE